MANPTNSSNNTNNIDQEGDEMTFDFKSFRSAQNESTLTRNVDDDPTVGSNLLKLVDQQKTSKKIKRSIPSRSNSAPLGKMRSRIQPPPGEDGPSFDWRQYAAKQKAARKD